MELDAVLENRRSIRKYKENGEISKDQIKEIVRAGQLAPSWKNSQVPRYYVVYSEEAKEQLRTEVLLSHNPLNCVNAVCYFVTALKKNRSGFARDGKPDNELENGWGIYDLGLANENMLLKAHELGYGTLVMGIRDEAKAREMLEVPEDEMIVSVISVGVPDIEPPMPKRKETEDIIKWY